MRKRIYFSLSFLFVSLLAVSVCFANWQLVFKSGAVADITEYKIDGDFIYVTNSLGAKFKFPISEIDTDKTDAVNPRPIFKAVKESAPSQLKTENIKPAVQQDPPEDEPEIKSGNKAASLGNKPSKETLESLRRYYEGRQVTSKIEMPAVSLGVSIRNGRLDTKYYSHAVFEYGVGVETGEKVTITKVKVKGKNIEVHLNGGGYNPGGFTDIIKGMDPKRVKTDSKKKEGGSRVNLWFDHEITEGDVTVANINKLLSVALDVGTLAEKKMSADVVRVKEGMGKKEVFDLLGEPKSKQADLNSDALIERWLYDFGDLKTHVVVFEKGKVTKVQSF